MKMKSKHILSIKDLSIKDINNILAKAEKFLHKNSKKKKLSQRQRFKINKFQMNTPEFAGVLGTVSE